jgi:hypothetical protein
LLLAAVEHTVPLARVVVLMLISCSVWALPQVAQAQRTVAVFFRGFNADQGDSGMDRLAAHLGSVLGGDPAHPFSSTVLNYTEQQQGFDFVDGFSDADCIILFGHSFGADAAIGLAEDLGTVGTQVDLLVQLDYVQFDGLNDTLPANVLQGYNYYQTGEPLEILNGFQNVMGSVNVNVETEYGVAPSVIRHTEIDCPLFGESNEADYQAVFGAQPDLYSRIQNHIALACASAQVPSLGPFALGILLAILTSSAARLRALRGETRSPGVVRTSRPRDGRA